MITKQLITKGSNKDLKWFNPEQCIVFGSPSTNNKLFLTRKQSWVMMENSEYELLGSNHIAYLWLQKNLYFDFLEKIAPEFLDRTEV